MVVMLIISNAIYTRLARHILSTAIYPAITKTRDKHHWKLVDQRPEMLNTRLEVASYIEKYTEQREKKTPPRYATMHAIFFAQTKHAQ